MGSKGYLSNIKFLVVDDNTFARTLIRRILLQFGANDIQEASNGEAAMEEVIAYRPDIIIVDWMMKPVDGMEFVRWLRDSKDSPDPFTPVIMVSAFSHMTNVLQARDAGINEFLAKPISAKTLLTRIQAVIEKPRQFVRADAYFGPDRRRRPLPHRGSERRGEDDEVVDLGPSTST
ncbi:MAG TPA: response regulator [Magnetovibrio sp.]